MRAAAERFIGPGQDRSAAFRLIYRSFDHKHMRTVCDALKVSTLKAAYKTALGRPSVSQDIRDFAGEFRSLQELRHFADYDPFARFSPLDASSTVDAAEAAIGSFDRAAPDEQADVLALLMVKART